jgi:hypothetical protein
MHKTLFLRIMFTMKKAITTVHTIIVILGLLATAGWSGYYLYNQRQFNTENNASRLPALVKKVSSALNNSESLYDKGFGDEIKMVFTENKDIIALSIYSYDTGIEYFYSRNGQVKIVNSETDSLEQNPEYKGLSFSNSIGSIPLQIKNKPGSNIDIIFTVLPRTSVFYVLKIALLAVIILFVITLLLIVAFSLSKEKEPEDKKSKKKVKEEWTEEADTSSEFSDAFAEDMSDSSPDSGFSDDNFGSEKESSSFSMDDDLDFDLPSDGETSDSGFSIDDDLGIDSLELPDDSIDSDLNLDDLGDMGDLDDDLSDDMNLEDTIPDIPDEEDLLGMDHEELPVDDNDDAVSDISDDDFAFPADDSLFDEMSSDDLDLEDDLEEAVPALAGDGSPTLYNPETGLGWEAFLEERLGLELERSASFDQDLVLLMIRDMGGDSDMEQISAVVRDEYSYHDLIFEAGKNSLAMIEPNKDLDDAISDAQNLIKKLEQESGFGNLKCGLSSRNGRLITGKRLIKEADTSLNKADEENPIVGFRSDPEKFREYLSKNS